LDEIDDETVEWDEEPSDDYKFKAIPENE